jgi:hypothetical protein
MSSQPRLQAVNGDLREEPGDAPQLPRAATDSAAGGANPPSAGNAGRAQKQRADRSLPTDRLNFEKQVEVLRVIAQMSGNSRRPVTAEDLSAAIGLKGNTGGLSNKFFRDSGWVVSAGRGMYAATEPLMDYHRHLNVDPQDVDGARRYLAASAEASWYWEALEPMLEGGARQTIVLHTLSKAAGAYEHTPQLLLIVTWLEWLGLVRREGDLVLREASEVHHSPEQGDSEPMAEDIADNASSTALSVPDLEAAEVHDVESPKPQPQESQPPAVDTSALLTFSFSVRITAEDAAKLSAEQLQSILDFAEKLRG